MKRKSTASKLFIDGLRNHIDKHIFRPRNTNRTSEAAIHGEYQAILREYLEQHYRASGGKNVQEKVRDIFYWEGQDGQYSEPKINVFGSRNYPDFIFKAPYKIAIEYKQSASGALMKQGIGQALMHTLSGEFDFAYLLFHDQTQGQAIRNSSKNPLEAGIGDLLWRDFNVYLHIVG